MYRTIPCTSPTTRNAPFRFVERIQVTDASTSRNYCITVRRPLHPSPRTRAFVPAVKKCNITSNTTRRSNAGSQPRVMTSAPNAPYRATTAASFATSSPPSLVGPNARSLLCLDSQPHFSSKCFCVSLAHQVTLKEHLLLPPSRSGFSAPRFELP